MDKPRIIRLLKEISHGVWRKSGEGRHCAFCGCRQGGDHLDSCPVPESKNLLGEIDLDKG